MFFSCCNFQNRLDAFGYGLKWRAVFQSQFSSGMDEAMIRMENPLIAAFFLLL